MLALIDRNFQGFGKELFTDAGKYVIHFGSKPSEAAEQARLSSVWHAVLPCMWTVHVQVSSAILLACCEMQHQ